MSAAPVDASTGYQLDNVGSTNLKPGQDVTVNANGFGPNTEATITLYSTPVLLKTVTADSTGVVRTTVTIPADTATGNHRIEVAGVDRDGAAKTVSFDVTVSTTGSPSGGLPATGADMALILAIGGLALGLGWMLLGAARQRQTA